MFLATMLMMIQFPSALGALLAPDNVSVDSLNFHHVLRWDPGPGTPPGTQYKVFCRINKKARQLPNPSNVTTSYTLKLRDVYTPYYLSVQASHHGSSSAISKEEVFTPFRDTVIGPPVLSLEGCGDCLRLGISLPKPDSRSDLRGESIQQFYGAFFKILTKKAEGKPAIQIETSNTSYVVNNLERGVEYCVQVHTRIVTNTNTRPSEWMCAFTSEPRRVLPIVAAVAAALILLGGGVMTLMVGLAYTGFLCKLKTHLPRTLLAALRRGYILTPERTVPDLVVSITSKTEEKVKMTKPKTHPLTAGGPNSEGEEEDDDEEDEEEEGLYVDRAGELSSPDTSAGRDSRDASGGPISGDSGSLSVVSSGLVEEAEPVVQEEGGGALGRVQAEHEGTNVSFTPDGGRVGGVSGHAVGGEEEEEEAGSSSGNINLFSVTLGALQTDDEEEEEDATNSTVDIFKWALLPTDLHHRTLLRPSNTESQRELMTSLQPEQTDGSLMTSLQPEQTDGSLMTSLQPEPTDGSLMTSLQPEQTDGSLMTSLQPEQTDSGYLGNAKSDKEEEEEEFSGYMGR